MNQDYLTIVRFRNLRDHGITFSRPMVRRMMQEGAFPAAVELSSMAVGWRLSDIQNWLANRPVRTRARGPHGPETRAKMRAAWERRKARRDIGSEAA